MRIRALNFLFAILFILLAAYLYYLQVIKGPLYRDLSYKNSIRLLNIAAPRGIIYDRNDNAIVDNTLAFGVFIVPQEANDVDTEIAKLSGLLNIPESLLKRNYKRNYRAPFAPCELLKSVSKREAILIEESKLDMPGVLVGEFPSRRYIYKEAFAHVVGYMGEINKSELELLRSYGYNAKDLIGKDGIEKVIDGHLRGRDGGMQVQVDNRGRQVKILNFRRPRKGNDISLAMDAKLQNFLWKAMKGKKGAAVFMDVSSGEILAMVSVPSYDPGGSILSALNDSDAPLLNRAIMGQYPPGSIFKIVVALTGLESEKITSETGFLCQGRLKVGAGGFHCWNRDGHGLMRLKDAIAQSCNIYFYNAGLSLGAEKILEYARSFGLGKKTHVELLGEMSGFLPSRAWKKAERRENWYAGDTANLSIGQGYVLATPLQIVRMVAAVANGGYLVEPHILKREPKKIKLKLQEKNLQLIRSAMSNVVNGEHGTGFRAWSSTVSIAGKTGTSQSGGGLRTHAWFAGFAPYENPMISFVVFLEHGGSGGEVAALIARKAAEYWYKNK
ncbi:penicillin-binding protein 2 [Candidatus Omnitrophota bacterium]